MLLILTILLTLSSLLGAQERFFFPPTGPPASVISTSFLACAKISDFCKSLKLRCRGRESNPHAPCGAQDFKSRT
jgi:hypothetical protein